MNDLKDKLETEHKRAKALCTTDNNWDYPYSYGIKFAIDLIDKKILENPCVHPYDSLKFGDLACYCNKCHTPLKFKND